MSQAGSGLFPVKAVSCRGTKRIATDHQRLVGRGILKLDKAYGSILEPVA